MAERQILGGSVRPERFYTTVSVVAVVVVLALWELSSVLGWVDPVFLPSPQTVWASLADLVQNGYKGNSLLAHISVSMVRLFTAIGLIVVIGVPLGMLAGVSRLARSIISPFIEFYRAIPPLAYYTLIVLWMGIGDGSKEVLLFLSGFAPFLIAVTFAVENVSRVRIEAARSLGAGRMRLLTSIVFRECLPDILTALRTSVGITYATLVAAEMVAATAGIGWLVLDASKYLRNDVVYAGVILMGVIAIVLNELILLLVKVATPWSSKGSRVAHALAALLIAVVLGAVVAVGAASVA